MKKIDLGKLHAMLKPLADSSRPISKIRYDRWLYKCDGFPAFSFDASKSTIRKDQWLYKCDGLPGFLFVASENASHSERMFAIFDQIAIVKKQAANPPGEVVSKLTQRDVEANFQLLLKLGDEVESNEQK